MTYVTTEPIDDFCRTVPLMQQLQQRLLTGDNFKYFRLLQKPKMTGVQSKFTKAVESRTQEALRSRRPVYFEVTKLRLNKGICVTCMRGLARLAGTDQRSEQCLKKTGAERR